MIPLIRYEAVSRYRWLGDAEFGGYGGGPSTIPLMRQEIVNHYSWLDDPQFADVLAMANALPGPIATKISAFVGYRQAGWAGAVFTTIATVLPSSLALILLLRILKNYRQSSVVKGMTLLVQPVIAVMMLLLTWDMGKVSVGSIGIWQTLGISATALLAMAKWRIHPALVILAAFLYGSLVTSHNIA